MCEVGSSGASTSSTREKAKTARNVFGEHCDVHIFAEINNIPFYVVTEAA